MRLISKHTDLAKTLAKEEKIQSQALNVAMRNVELHNGMLQQKLTYFRSRAERKLSRQLALIETINLDLEILRGLRIHHALRNCMVVDSAKSRGTLLDLVDERRIQILQADAEHFYKRLSGELRTLRALEEELMASERELQSRIAEGYDLQSLDTIVSDTEQIQSKARFLRDKIKRDLGRIYDRISELLQVPVSSLRPPSASPHQSVTSSGADQTTISSALSRPLSSGGKKKLEALTHLAEYHVNDYLPKLGGYESDVRKRVAKLAWDKRRSMEHFLVNMNLVARLQSETDAIDKRLETASKELEQFEENHDTRELETPHEVLFAYVIKTYPSKLWITHDTYLRLILQRELFLLKWLDEKFTMRYEPFQLSC